MSVKVWRLQLDEEKWFVHYLLNTCWNITSAIRWRESVYLLMITMQLLICMDLQIENVFVLEIVT